MIAILGTFLLSACLNETFYFTVMYYKVDDIKYAKLDGRSDNGIDSLIRVDGYYTPFYDSIKNSPINILPFGLSHNNSISYPFHYTGMYC